MDVSVTLTVEDQSFDVLQCKYGFRRKTNSKGYPLGGLLGGEIFITLESTAETLLLERLLTERPALVSGSLEFWDEQASSRIRTLEWPESYVYEDFKLELVEKEEGND